MYDLIIVGGGPAGVAAGVYAARKKIKTLFITQDWGGQSTESSNIENWIGTIGISGNDFGKALKEHLVYYSKDSVDIKEGEKAESISKNESGFSVKTDRNTYESKTVLVTTGSHRKKLDIPGAEKFENKGIMYCASCDGPLFSGQDVVVIGGGNAGFESATQLLSYCNSVTLLNRSDTFKADPVTVEGVRKNPKAKIITNAVPLEIKGDKFVSALVYKDTKSGEVNELNVSGIFVEIGLLPTTWFVEKIGLEMNEVKQIKVDPKNQRTSMDGIWAAGDCTDGLFHQNNIAAGDAIKALEDIYIQISRMK